MIAFIKTFNSFSNTISRKQVLHNHVSFKCDPLPLALVAVEKYWEPKMINDKHAKNSVESFNNNGEFEYMYIVIVFTSEVN